MLCQEGRRSTCADLSAARNTHVSNNGVYCGQETPHFHFHVVPRQKGSDWGIGPPQIATFESAGRQRGTPHDPSGDAQRRERVQVSAGQLARTADLIRLNLPA